jgi:hypothetical protein
LKRLCSLFQSLSCTTRCIHATCICIDYSCFYFKQIPSKPFNLVLTKADIPDSNRKYEILMDQLDNWDTMIAKLKSKNNVDAIQVPSSKPRFESVHFISPRLELRNRKKGLS